MKIIKTIIIAILVVVASYFVLALFGPSSYKVTRTIKIAAPIDVVFDQTSIFANWNEWSPWAKLDANAKYTIENDNQKPGATMAWVGNPENVGSGIMTSTKVEKNKTFLYDLSFIEPFEMTSYGGFVYEELEGEVLVSWYDEGEFGFFIRPMMMFMDMDAQLGSQFDKGLAGIKEICEKSKPIPSKENEGEGE